VNALTIERCIVCGLPVRKEGEKYCIRHDVLMLISEGYHKALERMKSAARVPGKQLKHKQRLQQDGKTV
jgi:hypothetical protein